MNIQQKIDQLTALLTRMEAVTVAVSGGVDSMTLATIAQQTLGANAHMVHAISPAVPAQDSQRVADYARTQQWEFRTVQTGEIDRDEYKQNPVNRCYYCKSCLYQTLGALNLGQVISGTNTDDLGDYRPGLIAADEHRVRHPYVEAGISKADIRAIATQLGLDDIAELPASPCLASRVETGTPIQPERLALINRVENRIRAQVDAKTVRCRLGDTHLELQIESDVLDKLSTEQRDNLRREAGEQAIAAGVTLPVHLAPYRRGSAFLRSAS